MSGRACPSESNLRSYQRGELSAASRAAIAEHLNTCPSCQARNGSDTPCNLTSVSQVKLVEPIPPRPSDATDVLGGAAPAKGTEPTSFTGKPRLRGYEILGTLGRGGMGIVFKARQVELNRLVALKVTSWGNCSTLEELARFRNEAEAVARLQHPNLVQIYEIGQEDGELFLSLEYVNGGDLEDRLAGQPQPPRTAAQLVETLARAIHYAHEHGVIHRDLKPANILLQNEGTKPPDYGTPKITDFGLAKQVDRNHRLTRTGMAVGTPYYMSPEQALGQTELFGPTLDVYSLGVILYQMMTGNVPFKAATSMEILRLVQMQEPVAPRRLQPRLPRDLQTICLKCLEKEPRKRYATAKALADDLRRFLDGESIVARPTPVWEHAWKRARRQPLTVALVAGIILTTLAGAVGVLGQWHAAVREGERARREEQEASAARNRAEASLYVSRVAQARLELASNNNVDGARALLEQGRPQGNDPDRRGWEWHYLQGLLHADLLTLRGPTAEPVFGIAFSPDGRLLAAPGGTFAGGGDVLLWDALTGRQEAQLRGHTKQVNGVAFSPDGQRLASSGMDQTIRIWNVATHELLWTLKCPAECTRTLGFSPDGKLLLSGHVDHLLQLWDVAEGKVAATVRGHRFGVFCVAFSPDGRWFASGSRDREGAVIVWDAATRREYRRLDCGEEPVHGVVFTPDGTQLAASVGRTVMVWDVASGRRRHTFGGVAGRVTGLAVRPDGQQLATAGSDRTVRVWNIRSGAAEGVYRGHTGRVLCVAYHPSGGLLASADDTGQVKVWDLTRDADQLLLDGDDRFHPHIQALALDPEGRVVRLLRGDGQLKTLDAGTGLVRSVQNLPWSAHRMTPATIAILSGDARLLATLGGEEMGSIRLWDAANGRPLATWRRPSVSVDLKRKVALAQLAFDQDARRLAVSVTYPGPEGFREITVWDTASGETCFSTRVPLSACSLASSALALSPGGERLAFDEYTFEAPGPSGEAPATIRSARVKVCDLDRGEDGVAAPRWTWAVGTAALRAIAFRPDERSLAVADAAGAVQLWDLHTGQPLYARPLEGQAYRLAFSPDSRRLAATDRDRVKLWDVLSGQELLTLQGVPPSGSEVSFNPQLAWSGNGQQLAASNWERMVNLWDSNDRDTPESRTAERDAGARREFAWHLRMASQALTTRQAGAFAFHWQRVRDVEPPNAEARLWRGRLLGVQGQWQEAAAEYGRVLAAEPSDDPMAWTFAACSALLAGDTATAQTDLRALWQRCGTGFEEGGTMPLLRRVAVVDRNGEHAEALLRRAEALLAGNPNPSWMEWHALALAHYRAGHFADTVRYGQRSLERDPQAVAQPVNYPLLALAHYQLGNANDATFWLGKADQWLEQRTDGKPDYTNLLLSLDATDGLTFLVLHKEAQQRLRP